MENIGSEIALRHVPALPFCAAGSYLHAKLAWHLDTVCRSPGIVIFVKARSLVSGAPTWKNNQVSCLVVTRGVFMCTQARNHIRKYSEYHRVYFILLFCEWS